MAEETGGTPGPPGGVEGVSLGHGGAGSSLWAAVTWSKEDEGEIQLLES